MTLDKDALAAAVAAMEQCKAPPLQTKREGGATTMTVHGVFA